MSWFNTEGKCPHHYVWSKTRYVRNPAKLPFSSTEGEKYAELCDKLDALLTQNGFRKEIIQKGKSPEVCAFAEKQFTDEDFIGRDNQRALYFNEPCNLIVAIGGKNMISIQSILPGCALSETQNIATGAEELIDSEIELAYSEKYGYLSPDPSECGSGTVYSAALYLPALRYTGQIERFRLLCRGAGVELAPFYLEGHGMGDLFTASTKASFFLRESEGRARFEAICEKLVQNEKSTERMIFKDKSKLIIDKAWRAYGVLRYARRMDEAEMLSLLSDIRLALTVVEKTEDLPPVTLVLLNSLLADGLNASVITAKLPLCQNEEECLTSRAALTASRLQTASS